MTARVLTYGPHALLVEVDDPSDVPSLYAAVQRLVGQDARRPPVEVVPAARTVLLDGLVAEERDGWQRDLLSMEVATSAGAGEGHEHALPVVFDGADLSVVAGLWQCGDDEVVDRLVSADIVVAFCGFSPGFAYCRPMHDPWPTVPRRDDPRAQVPPGSVALAGDHLGFYPQASPGGWQLVGRTDAPLFDVTREPPALLAPGDRVRLTEAT